MRLNGENCYKVISCEDLAANDKIDRIFNIILYYNWYKVLETKDTMGLSVPASGLYKCKMTIIFKHLS